MGLINDWAAHAQRRLKLLDGMADWILHNPNLLGSDDPRLATLWLWHSAEESEHNSTAFDLYQALDGSHDWRITWFRRVTLIFLGDTLRQTLNNLRRDGTLWQWRTWKSGAAFLFGRRGLVRQTWRPWRDYLRRDFHPSQHDAVESSRWLAEHRDQYQAVGASA